MALAGLAYLVADVLQGNGFLAALVAGLMFGQVLRGRCQFFFRFIQTERKLLSCLAFFAIGALLLPVGFADANSALAGSVVLSLFLLRPAAIWLALSGTGTPMRERLFYGWFGPRGLARAFFALLVLDAFDRLQMRDGIPATAALRWQRAPFCTARRLRRPGACSAGSPARTQRCNFKRTASRFKVPAV